MPGDGQAIQAVLRPSRRGSHERPCRLVAKPPACGGRFSFFSFALRAHSRFNQVDAAFKSDLKEINELNYARFEATLEQRVAELRADIRGIETSLERALKEQTRFYFLACAVLLVAIIGLWFR